MMLRAMIPWWGKIGAKIVLSRLGIPYSVFQALGIFRHGYMDSAQYVTDVFMAHVNRAGLSGTLQGKTILEIGPGDGVGTALLSYAYGARTVLIDTGRYARQDVGLYQAIATALDAQGLRVPHIEDAASIDEVVTGCAAVYLTQGLKSWAEVPDASVDLIFSQAVLEHIRRHEFEQVIRECRRVLKPDGVCSHRIDMQDHLGGGLNNLRFSGRRWESGLFASSGFYTNRIQYSRMLEIFSRCGFSVSVTDLHRWDALPIARKKLAAEFQAIPDEELCVSGFDVLLRPAP
ncbi:MAG: methyltransferase domain-containing protein [Nevskiales bacterium]